MNENVQQYIEILGLAMNIGQGLVDAIKGHAAATLTPEEYAQLQAKWDEDAARAKKNAGL